jgi:FKBP-type peptidyl-prolyl cis-trans isomerase
MRNFFVLALLGVSLITIAIVVRSGILQRKNPGAPINSAMREAMEKNELSETDAALIAKNFPDAKKTSSGLLYIVRAPGEGPTPPRGAQVRVNYEGRFLDGTPFDSSRNRGPLTFTVGAGDVIRGWDEAILTMKKGERRTLIIPYWLGYGAGGRPPIPPRATLVFDVELLDFR